MRKVRFFKPIGIVGGAGPVASAFLYTTIIELCQKQYGSNDYDEFPEIILDSYPFIRGNPDKVQQDLAFCFKKLKKAGAELISLASNSLHAFLPDVSQIAFVNLIVESFQEAKRCSISKALILSSQATIDLKLYEHIGLQCTYPSIEDQKQIQKMIRKIAVGIVTENQGKKLKEIIELSKQDPAINGVLIACTELPLIYRKFLLSTWESLTVIDTLEILAKRLLLLSQEK